MASKDRDVKTADSQGRKTTAFRKLAESCGLLEALQLVEQIDD